MAIVEPPEQTEPVVKKPAPGKKSKSKSQSGSPLDRRLKRKRVAEDEDGEASDADLPAEPKKTPDSGRRTMVTFSNPPVSEVGGASGRAGGKRASPQLPSPASTPGGPSEYERKRDSNIRYAQQLALVIFLH